ncbi:SidA/IucD/PvdA family monooxygenase [Tsukamurella sp. NPDC003166]|uniref:lysine N(6)-hydroxylase/L-ornithine N(5)-oxygenase family protein n=1 Tax=Tsukamurella sp. NPDC003166 TaxID=3154444 RepID=UPI0033B1E94A
MRSSPGADVDGDRVDVLGVGFGPANLALAIALGEIAVPGRTVRFLERRPEFAWHPGMLLPGTSMQIAFLKDLVTLRNQTSPFSFVAYLGARGRLVDFVNRAVLTPERAEFADYLAWAASSFTDVVAYGQEVTDLSESADGARFAVRHRGPDGVERTTRARSVVVARGLRPVLPEWARAQADTDRILHNIELVPRLDDLARELPGGLPAARILVVGGGQSAAEVAIHLHDAGAAVDLAFHGFGLAAVDESPFVNQVFDPDVVDEFDAAAPEVRTELLRRHGNTNYAAVEHALTHELYDRWYREAVTGPRRLRVHRTTEVSAVRSGPGGVEVTLRRLTTGETCTTVFDAVVCATGFEPGGLSGLGGIAPPGAEVRVARSHRAVIDGREVPGLYVQGADLPGHGLGTTLLSTVAVRAGEIARVLDQEEAP